MKPTQLFHDINTILSENQKKAFRKLLYKSVFFSLLDLVSVAYLIPVLLLLLDKNKLTTLLTANNISLDFLDTKTIGISIVLLVLFYTVKNLFQAKFNVNLYRFLYSLSHAISMDILAKYLNGDYLNFQQQNKGNLIQNATTVARDFATCLLASLILLISESLTFLVITIALLFCYFKLTLMVVLVALLFALIIYRIKKSEMQLINTTYKEITSKANAELLNILDGYLEIKSSGNHKPFLNAYKKHNQKVNEVSSRLNSSSGNYSKYMEVFLITGIALLVGYTFLFSTSNDTLVIFAILGALSIKIIPSMSKILNAITLVNSYFYSIEILKTMQPPVKRIHYSNFDKTLEFEDIDFSYKTEEPLLEQLNFTIKKGEIVGIKGITGAGKTTFLHLVTGLVSPNKGSISIDGKKIENNPEFSFISYVSQQPFLFNGTLLDNITMRESKETIDLDYIQYLTASLDLDKTVKSLPNGLQTIISHNTSKLSGGQKQRLALLRALYHRPQLLILDESTNQQNEELEVLIYTLIRKISATDKMAVITVSHHSEIASFCDKMLVLEKNKFTQTA